MEGYGRKVQWDVKRSVFVASAFYLFYYGGKACLFPFLTLYFRQLGLTASQTGLALGMKALLWFCISPVWVTLVRRLQKTRTFLCYSIFIIIGSTLSLTLLPPADPELPLQLCMNETPRVTSPVENLESIPFLNASTTYLLDIKLTTIPTILDLDDPTEIAQQFSSRKKANLETELTYKENEKNSTTLALLSSSTIMSSTAIVASLKQTTATESYFQLAKRILPTFKATGVTSDQEDVIKDIIARYTETKDWPSWKKNVIIRQIRNLLARAEQSGSSNLGTNRRSIAHKSQIPSRHRFHGWKRRDDNETDSTSIFDVVKNISNVLSVKKDAAIRSLTPFVMSNSYLFLCVLIILAAGEILSAPVELLSDNSLYYFLDELDSLSHYGKHRASALIGAALCGISVSIVVYFSPCLINGTINRFHIHFYIFAMLLGISFILAPFYPSFDSASSSTRSRLSTTSLTKCSCTLMVCCSCRHFLLFITIFVVGITQAPMQNFMLWMVQDMEGSSELVYGSFVSANAICSMISGLLGRRLIKLMKPCSAAMLSLLSIAMQLVLYAFVPNPWIILPLQLLNITGLSFLWTIVTHHTSTTMSSAYEGPKKISSVHVFARASQQRNLHATYVSVYQGLSYGFGSIISGFLYDYLHGNMAPVLVGGGILVTAWGAIFVVYQCCCLPRKLRRKYSHLISDSESDMDQIENRDFAKRRVEKNDTYHSLIETKRKRRKDRKKTNRLQLLHATINSDTSDSDEHDWLKSAAKKESQML